MKGIVFNLLEEVVTTTHGEDTWDEVLDAAGVDGAYTSLGSYPDEQFGLLVMAAADALGRPVDDVVRWFGRQTMPLFALRFAPLFADHDSTRSFVLGLNEVIHPEVRKLYPGADTPQFIFSTEKSGKLLMEYRSRRRLCSLAEGLLLGAGDHYGEEITIEHPSCLKRGDASCVLAVDFR